MIKKRITELREKCKLSFEDRKNDSVKRLKFLQDAKILDEKGNYNERFFNIWKCRVHFNDCFFGFAIFIGKLT